MITVGSHKEGSDTRRALPSRGKYAKLARFAGRLRDPEWRRYGYLLLGGKVLGIALLFAFMFFISSIIGSGVQADEAPLVKGNDIINPINTL